MFSKIFRTMLILLLVAGGFFAPVAQVHAATIHIVTNDNDSGTGSLRQAILNAGSGDTITFDPLLAGRTITLTSQLDINKNLTIDGSGLEPRVTISGNNSVRVMSIGSNTTATIKSLIIKNGKQTGTNYTYYGGAIFTGSNSVLSIENVAFIENSAYEAGAIYVGTSANVTVFKSEFIANSSQTLGGAIYVSGYLTLRNSTITGNTASSGGAIYIYYTSSTFENNTFSDNRAGSGGAFIIYQGSNDEVYMKNNLFSGNLATSNSGGALYIDFSSIPAILNIESNTFYANQAAYAGGAIYNNGIAVLRNNTFSHNQANKSGGNAGASLFGGGTLYNNIFANNTGGGECYSGGTPAGSNNLAEDGSLSCRPTLTGDPGLLALADNGGPTNTMALAPASIALDAGDDASCNALDQRGAPRPQGAHCDLGSVEFDETPPTLLSTFPENNGIWVIDQPLELTVTFTEQMNQYRADGHVADPSNYMLVNDNGDGFQTNSCADGVAAGDDEYSIIAVDYDLFTSTATLFLDYILFPDGSFSGLPEGNYQLYLCGTNPSLRDVAGNKINGGLLDAVSTFRIVGLDGGSVPENQPLNTEVVAFLSPAGSNLTYSLVSGVFECNGTDNSFFTVDNQRLVTNAVMNYEVKNLFIVCLSINEAGNQIHTQQLVLRATNLNEPPTNIALSNNTISENLPIGTQVGVFSSLDPDSGSSFTYNLEAGILGCDGTDNNSFAISGSSLKSNVVLDFEAKSSYSICVRSMDNGGLNYWKAFVISAIDTNDPPTDIILTPSSIAENLPGDTLVGYLIATDVDGPSTTAFTLVPNKVDCSSSGFNWFTLLNGNQIRSLAPLDYETINSYTLCLRATDSLGSYYEESVTVTILDVFEPPSTFVISGNAGISGATLSYTDGTLKTVTADGSGDYTVTVPHGWSGVITPSTVGYAFVPESRTYTNIAGDQENQDYVAKVAAEVEVYIGTGVSPVGTYKVPQGEGTRPSYLLNNGPVRVVSATGLPIISTERHAWKVNGVYSSYAEMMGLPANQLTDTYIFPWYNNATMNTELRVGNVGSGDTTITVKIAGSVVDSFPLAQNASARKSYTGVNNGPMEVSSSGGVKIIATHRFAWMSGGVYTSITELMGLPAGQLTDTYVFPWYNNQTMDTQLRIGNVGAADTTITIKIGGSVVDTFPLAQNAGARKSYDLNAGPVEITSSGGVDIIATERHAWKVNGVYKSYAEMMGLPGGALSDRYVFPWYNNQTMSSELRVGNVGSGDTTITVKIAGAVVDTFPLAQNASARKTYNYNSGPMEVTSSGSVKIITTHRFAWMSNGIYTSITEMMGLPYAQLTDTYVFPWYNNTTMDTQLRIGVP